MTTPAMYAIMTATVKQPCEMLSARGVYVKESISNAVQHTQNDI